jgi:hypothetical protein
MNHRFVILTSLVAFLAFPAYCQTGAGSWEFSLSGNGGTTSTTSEATFGGQTYTDDGESESYIGLDLRAGYYVVDGLSLEPEIYWLAVEGMPPMFNLGANAAYTFTIPEAPVRPFLTVGYGVGNSVPVMQRLFNRSSNELDVPVFRAGGGVKVFIVKQVALKLEYRYERYTQESSDSFGPYFSYSSKTTSNFHNVLVGFSIFLPNVD